MYLSFMTLRSAMNDALSSATDSFVMTSCARAGDASAPSTIITSAEIAAARRSEKCIIGPSKNVSVCRCLRGPPLPNLHAIRWCAIELVAGLHIECHVPRIDVGERHER